MDEATDEMPRPFACMPNPHPNPDPDQADMGGMGFIQSNHSRILFNSTMISFNVCSCRRPP